MLRFVLAVVVAVAGCATVHPKQAPVDVDGGGRNVCAELGCNDDRASFKDECVQAGCAPAPLTLYPAPAATPLPDRTALVDIERPELIAWQMPLELTQHAAARVPLDVASQVPALGGSAATVPAFQFTCTTSAQAIRSATAPAGYVAIWVWNSSSTPVYFGDKNVTSTGMPICASASCVQASQTYEARELGCLSSSGNVVINVQVAKP